jgi:hypothetical protein
MVKHITCAAALAALLAVPAAAAGSQARQAGGHRPGVAAQLIKARVTTGLRSGQLTRGEAARIRVALAEFRAQAQAMRADGKLSPDDRQTLKRRWRSISRRVFQLKHNSVRRTTPSA